MARDLRYAYEQLNLSELPSILKSFFKNYEYILKPVESEHEKTDAEIEISMSEGEDQGGMGTDNEKAPSPDNGISGKRRLTVRSDSGSSITEEDSLSGESGSATEESSN